MSKPNLIIKRSDRTRTGALPTSRLQRIKGSLLGHGFILLPSDTCYSVAALAIDRRVQSNVNNLLSRSKEPISLSFPNIVRVENFVYLNPISASLLERFTPGPITVVCNARAEVPIELTSQIVGSSDRTIGVRISDSFIERDVASCIQYPITTVAVRDPADNSVVKNFEQAIEIVEKGMRNLENIIWGAAVEGEEFYANQSTVVHVTNDAEKLKLLREGDIPFKEIQLASSNMPFWSIEDWT